MNVTFRTSTGETFHVTGRSGESLMEAAVAQNVPGIEAICGGNCACATCHVAIADDWFGRVGLPSEMEISTFYFGSPRRRTSRLSCQITLSAKLDGLQVEVVA